MNMILVITLATVGAMWLAVAVICLIKLAGRR